MHLDVRIGQVATGRGHEKEPLGAGYMCVFV